MCYEKLYRLHAEVLKFACSIVFLHGLRGDAYKSWMKDDICWPRDLLHDDIPHARIMTVICSKSTFLNELGN